LSSQRREFALDSWMGTPIAFAHDSLAEIPEDKLVDRIVT
jgi:hypothetical protein